METVLLGASAPEVLPALDADYHARVDNLHHYILGQTDGAYDYAPYDYMYGDALTDVTAHTDPPAALLAISEGAQPLVAGLADPIQTHNVLDSLLKLQAVQAAEPNLTPTVYTVMAELDKNGIGALQTIIDGADEHARVKALRLICGRAADDSTAIPNLAAYLPAIAKLDDARERAARAAGKQLYDDIMAVAFPRNRNNTQRAENLLDALLNGFGQDHSLLAAWDANGSKWRSRDWWTIQNLETMFAIERLEPGMCAKIHETFGTKNFARRTPAMLIDMYTQRQEHPETPYVLSFINMADHNLISADAPLAEEFYDQLKAQGLRFEEHEVSSIEEVEAVAEEAVTLHTQHGSDITDVIFNCHGNQEGICLHDKREGANIKSYNVHRLRALLPAMRSNARFILLSCLSGVRKRYGGQCIAEHMAYAVGKDVVAAKRETSTILQVVQQDGQPRVEPLYRETYLPYWRLPRIGAVALKLAIRSNARRKRVFPGNQHYDRY